MDSIIIEVKTEWEILVERDCFGDYSFNPLPCLKVNKKQVHEWIVVDLICNTVLTTEEEASMAHSQYIDRTVTFEVEVRYVDDKAVDAECQTICPNFVKAWVEQEAIKQFNDERKEQKV